MGNMSEKHDSVTKNKESHQKVQVQK